MSIGSAQHKPSHYTAYLSTDAAKKAAAKKQSRVPVVLMVLAGMLMVAHVVARPTLDRAQQRVLDVLAPALQMAAHPLGIAQDKIQDVWALVAVQHENQSLRAENEKLKEWYQAALMLQSENEALRSLLNVEVPGAKTFVTARVIADGSTSYAKSLVVEGGRDAGIIKGQGVVSREGLIGRVLESGTRTSRVLLLQDINSRIPVLVEGANVRAILAGTNREMPVLNHLNSEQYVPDGERVITSGIGGLFPYGIPVGVTVRQADGTVGVQLYAAPSRSQHVQVVDYGIKPLLGDPIFNSAAAYDAASDGAEAN